MIADMANEGWPKADEDVRKSAKFKVAATGSSGPDYSPNGPAVSSPVAGATVGITTPPGWFLVIHASIRSHQE
jgi:hypothetical protein